MSNSPLKPPEYAFDILRSDVNGPLNLEETILSAQTSEPEWSRNETYFTDIEVLSGIPVRYTLRQTGSVDDFVINVRVLGFSDGEQIVGQVRSHLERVLGLKDDLPLFYKKFAQENEPLSATFAKLRGLRLMRGTNLYESLICSVLSQNNSARLWNRTARLLMKLYGDRVDFPDGSTYFLFPKPETLAKKSPRELHKRTSMGYRAKHVVQVSRLIVENDLRLEELGKLSYDEAVEALLDLPGVGPKVADCFLLYGMGRLEAAPVDVWIHRIVSKLYFRNRRVSRLKAARFLRTRYKEWAGYAQLYLFDFARRTTDWFHRTTGKQPA